MSMLDIRALDNFLNDYKDYSSKTCFIKMFNIKEVKDLLKEYAGYELKGFSYNCGILVDKEIYEALKRARYEADISYIKSWHYFTNEEKKRLERQKNISKLCLKPS